MLVMIKKIFCQINLNNFKNVLCTLLMKKVVQLVKELLRFF